MRYFFLVGIFFHLGLSAFSIGKAQSDLAVYDNYPTLEVVVNQFYQLYAPARDTDLYYAFRKDEEGVSVIQRDKNTRRQKGGQTLFWSKAEESFLELKIDLKDGKTPDAQDRQLALSEARYFDLHPFYGYDGWPGDVIRVFAGREDLSARQLNGLGRAYNAAAMHYMSSRSGMPASQSVLKFEEEFDPTLFDPEDLIAYEQNIKASIDAFNDLDNLDPAYPVIVGYPRLKKANQYVTAYFDLMMIGQKVMAKKWIRPNIYPSLMTTAAANLLNSCPPYAYLFTHGDNDTYPLIYLQESEGIRNDVTVINLSLLNDAVYVRYLMQDLSEEHQPSLSLPFEVYQGKSMVAFSVNKPDGKKDKAFEKEGFETALLQAAKNKKASLPFDEVMVSTPAKGHPAYIDLPEEARSGNKLPISARPGNYWLRQDIFLMDLIQTNAWERPICFSGATHPSSLLGMEPFLWKEGLVLRLHPVHHPLDETRPTGQNIHLAKSSELFRKSLSYEGLISWSDQVAAETVMSRQINRAALVNVLLSYISAGEYEANKELIPIFAQHFLVGKEAQDPVNAEIGLCAARLAMTQDARIILNPLYGFAQRQQYLITSGREKDLDVARRQARMVGTMQEAYQLLGDLKKVAQLKKMEENLSELYE